MQMFYRKQQQAQVKGWYSICCVQSQINKYTEEDTGLVCVYVCEINEMI